MLHLHAVRGDDWLSLGGDRGQIEVKRRADGLAQVELTSFAGFRFDS